MISFNIKLLLKVKLLGYGSVKGLIERFVGTAIKIYAVASLIG